MQGRQWDVWEKWELNYSCSQPGYVSVCLSLSIIYIILKGKRTKLSPGSSVAGLPQPEPMSARFGKCVYTTLPCFLISSFNDRFGIASKNKTKKPKESG